MEQKLITEVKTFGDVRSLIIQSIMQIRDGGLDVAQATATAAQEKNQALSASASAKGRVIWPVCPNANPMPSTTQAAANPRVIPAMTSPSAYSTGEIGAA